MPKMKRTFQVEIEAKLLVDAFDERSARKKIEKSFSQNRLLDADVRSSGEILAYEGRSSAMVRPELHRRLDLGDFDQGTASAGATITRSVLGHLSPPSSLRDHVFEQRRLEPLERLPDGGEVVPEVVRRSPASSGLLVGPRAEADEHVRPLAVSKQYPAPGKALNIQSPSSYQARTKSLSRRGVIVDVQ